MIVWGVPTNGLKGRKIIACLLDLLLVQACLSNPDLFKEYLMLMEDGKDRSPIFQNNITKKLIDGIEKINWGSYFD